MIRSNTLPEVAAALDFLKDALDEQGLIHVQEQDTDNPNRWTLAVSDKTGHVNVGLVGWNSKEGVMFSYHDVHREQRDKEDGIPENKSACWVMCDSADGFLLFLNGHIHKVLDGPAKKVVDK